MMSLAAPDPRHLFNAAINAVRGDRAVAAFLQQNAMPPPDQIIAVGKAANAMAHAALAHFGARPCLIITKYGHADSPPSGAQLIQAAHPVLDTQSLWAGAQLLERIATMPQGSRLLLLVSGGASALAEVPVAGITLTGLQDLAGDMLRSGADIRAINAARTAQSQIKGGKLLSHFGGASVRTLAISDVEGDDLGVIGSGLGAALPSPSFDFSADIIASNAIARAAAAQAAQAAGAQTIVNEESLYGDITDLAPRLAQTLRRGGPGVFIWGGEPTVVLPSNPGKGGRNQALGTLMARELAGVDGVDVLVAGTDGTDGPTTAAGARISGSTWTPSGDRALTRADALPWLTARQALFECGPTGTNVMDLVIAVRQVSGRG